MSVLEIKHDLFQLIVETNDAVLLGSVRNYFKKLQQETLSSEEMILLENRMLDIGLQQIEEGQTMSHEEARQKIKANLLNKQK